MIREFLLATSRGYQEAASDPATAAGILFQEVAADTADNPLPEPLDLNMLEESQVGGGRATS